MTFPGDLHQVSEPGREAVPGVVFHRRHLGRCAERVRDTLGRSLIIGREGNPDVTIIQDCMVRPVGAFELVQALGNQETANAVTGHESKLTFEEIEPPRVFDLAGLSKQELATCGADRAP